jgi:hypothetical protein
MKGKYKMFNNQKYVTKGIIADIPADLQNVMWNAISNMEVETKDYLQVFKFTVEKSKQVMVHTQEVPEYTKKITIEIDKPITAKIFVIDDISHSTMLLASEY